MLALVLLGSTAPVLGSGQEILSDAQDGTIDNCYTRAEYREALRLARDDERLYGTRIDTIEQAQNTKVTVPGEPCGSVSTAPEAVRDDDPGGSPLLWVVLAGGVTVVAVGAGAWARRGRDGGA